MRFRSKSMPKITSLKLIENFWDEGNLRTAAMPAWRLAIERPGVAVKGISLEEFLEWINLRTILLGTSWLRSKSGSEVEVESSESRDSEMSPSPEARRLSWEVGEDSDPLLFLRLGKSSQRRKSTSDS